MLRVSAAGMGDLTTEGHRDFEAGYITESATAPSRLTLVPEARITGRVATRVPGVSTAGLKIGLQNTNQSKPFWRYANRRRRPFRDARASRGLGQRFSDRPPQRRSLDLPCKRQPGVARWQNGEVTIELIEGVLVEGKVVEAGTGRPITGISMGMYGPARPRSGAAIIIAKTDENGRYRFRLPPGEAYLYVCDRGRWQPRSQDIRIPDVKAFTVPMFALPKAVTAPPDFR